MTFTAQAGESPHLTVKELAKRWRTTERAIYNMRHRRIAPPAFRRGKTILFPLAGVMAHEEAAMAADTTRAAA